MSKKNTSYQNDLNFVVEILAKEIIRYLDLYQIFEEESIYWNDEIDYVIGIITKTLKNKKPTQQFKIPPLFRNEDDSDFMKKLFRKAVLNYQANRKIIDEFTERFGAQFVAGNPQHLTGDRIAVKDPSSWQFHHHYRVMAEFQQGTVHIKVHR